MKNIFPAILALIIFLTATTQSRAETESLLGGQISVNVPLGSFADYWKTGFGFLVNYDYIIDNNIGIGIICGYSFWDSVEEYDPGYSYVYTNYPVHISAKYFFSSGDYYMPYAGIEYGFDFLDVNYKTPFDENKTEYTKTSISPFFGIYSFFSDNVAVNAGAKFTKIFDKFEYFTIYGGVSYSL